MNKKIIGATSLLAAGLVAGSFFSISGASASTHHVAKPAHVKAAAVTPTPTPSTGTTPPVKPPTFKAHTPETLITGDLAATLTRIALDTYPNATIVRIENDTDGAVSEVHLTTVDGKNITLKFDANNNIVATETGGPGFGGPRVPKGHDGHHGEGDNDGDGPAGFTPPASGAPVAPLNG